MCANSQSVRIHLKLWEFDHLIQRNGRLKISRRYGDSQLTRMGEREATTRIAISLVIIIKVKANGSIAHEAIMIRGSFSASSSRVFGVFKTCTNS